MPNVEPRDLKRISSRQSYHGYPTVAQLNGGELLVGRSVGRERHVCTFSQSHPIHSVVWL